MKKFIALAMVLVMALAIALPAFADPLVDVPDTHWAAEAVDKLTTLGIITGYTDGTFKGQQNITRYEVAVMIDRLLTYLEDLMDENQEAVIDIIDSRIMNIITPAAGENVSWLERVIVQNMSDMDAAKWNAVQEELDAHSKKIEELEAREIPYDSLVEIVEGIINSPAGSDPSLKGEIARLETMVNDLQEAQGVISDLQKEIDGLRSDLNKVSGNVGSNTDFLTLSGRISYIETQVAALKDLGASNAALSNDVASLSNTLKDLQNAISALQRNATMASSDILTLSGRISYLEQQLANQPTAAAELANLSNRLRALENQIANVPQESAIATLTNDYLTLSGRISYLEGKYASQGDGNAALAAEIETLKVKLDDLAALSPTGSASSTSPEVVNDLTVLNNKILELEKKVDGKLGELGYKNSDLANNIAALQSEIDELNATVVGMLEENGDVELNSTLYNMLLTLSGRIAYLESKFANFDPSSVQEYSPMIAEIQSDLNVIKGQITSTSKPATSAEIVNDLTVLNGKIIDLEKKVDNKLLSLGKEVSTVDNVAALQSEIDALKATIAGMGGANAGVDYSKVIAEIQSDLNAIKGQLASSSTSPEIMNDLTVLNGKILDLEKKMDNRLSVLGYKDSALTNDMTALQSEIDGLKATIVGILESDPDIDLNSTMYNMLLTMSGRLSYLEGKMATVLETERAVSANLKTINDQLLTLSGRIAYIEAKFANFNPSDVKDVSNELASIKSDLNTISGLTQTSATLDPSLVNDITVLNAKIIELDRKLNNLGTSGYTEKSVQGMISALDDRITNVTTQVEELGLDKTFAADIQAIKANIASIENKLNSQAAVDPNIGNDITVLNDKILALDAKLNSANNKIAEAGYADSNLKNEVTAIKKDIDDINSYVAALAVEDGTLIFDSKAYDYFLTLSGRISYLEGKIANLTAIDPKITDDVAVLAANVDGIVSKLEANGGYGYDPTIYNDIFVLNTKIMSLEDKAYQQGVANKAMASEIADLNARIKALEIQTTMTDASLSEKIEVMAEAMKAEAANNDQLYKNIEFANDITVLSNKILQLEKAVNSMGATNIAALEHRMGEVGDNVNALQSSTFANDENFRIELVLLKNSVDSLTRQLNSLGEVNVESIPVDQLNDIYAKVAEVEAEMAKVMAAVEEKGVLSSSSIQNSGNNEININVSGGITGTDLIFLYDRVLKVENNVADLEKLIAELREEMIAGDQYLADEIAKLAAMLADFMFDMNNEMNLKSDAADVLALADRVAIVESKLNDIANVDLEALKAEIAKLWDAMNNLKADDSIYMINDITVLADRIGKLEDKLYYVSSSDLAALRSDFAGLQTTIAKEDEKTQEKFNNITLLLGGIDNRIAELDSQIADIPVDDHLYFVNDIMVLNDKINKLDKKFTEAISAINTRLADLAKLENTVAEMGEALELLGSEFREELDALEARVTTLELGQEGLTQKLGDVTNTVNNHEVRITALEDEVASLNKLMNRIRISGDNELKFQHLYLNHYIDPAGAALKSPFDYHDNETYKNESKISNTTNLLVTFNPESGVKFELGMSLVLDDLFFSTKKDHANQFTLENSKANLSIVGDKVVANLYGGDIREKMPTAFTDYTLNTGLFAEDVYDKYEDYYLDMVYPITLRKFESVAGISGDVKFFNNTLTISSLLGKIVPQGYDYDNSYPFLYLYGVAGVFAPTENVKVGIRTVGNFFIANREDYNTPLFQNAVYGADFSVKFLEKLKASGEFAYSTTKVVPNNFVIDEGSAMQFNVTAGLEPGLVVSADFERIAEDYNPLFVIITKEEDNHHVEGQILNDIMNVGVTVKLPKVIGFTLSGKLEFKGDYDWQGEKDRVETLTLTYEPRLSTNNYLKLTAQAARTNDISPLSTGDKTLEYLGKIEYERAFMTFDASYTREDNISSAFPGTNISNIIEANTKFNIVKDVVTLKGGLKLEYDDFSAPIVRQKYYVEALVNLDLGKSVELDIAGRYYMSEHSNASEANKNDYTQLKASTTLGWNVTNTTKLNVGLSVETRKYQLDVADSNRPLYVRDGMFTTVSVGVEQKVFTSTTIGLGYNFKYNNLSYVDETPQAQHTEFSVNEFVFNVKTVF